MRGRGRRLRVPILRRPRQPHHRDQQYEDQRRDIEDIVGGKHECLLIEHAIQRSVALLRTHPACLHARERLHGRRVDIGDVIAELRVVQARAAFPQGKRDEGLKLADWWSRESKRRHVDAYSVGLLYAQLGAKERALDWLEKGFEQHSPLMPTLKIAAAFFPDSLRSDPRFQNLLHRMNFPP